MSTEATVSYFLPFTRLDPTVQKANLAAAPIIGAECDLIGLKRPPISYATTQIPFGFLRVITFDQIEPLVSMPEDQKKAALVHLYEGALSKLVACRVVELAPVLS